jgi:hypothetical protein
MTKTMQAEFEPIFSELRPVAGTNQAKHEAIDEMIRRRKLELKGILDLDPFFRTNERLARIIELTAELAMLR